MKPLKTSVSITIDNPILDKIKYLAEMDDRSLSSYINQVLTLQRTGANEGEKR